MEEKTLPPIKIKVSDPLTITAKSIDELKEKVEKRIKSKNDIVIYMATVVNVIIK